MPLPLSSQAARKAFAKLTSQIVLLAGFHGDSEVSTMLVSMLRLLKPSLVATGDEKARGSGLIPEREFMAKS